MYRHYVTKIIITINQYSSRYYKVNIFGGISALVPAAVTFRLKTTSPNDGDAVSASLSARY